MTASRNNGYEELALADHLEELRLCLIHCLLYLAVGTALCLSFSKNIIEFLKIPAGSLIKTFIIIKPVEMVSVYIKVSLVAALLISSPLIFYRLWLFLKPVVEERFRTGVLKWVIASFVLFALGGAFMYRVALPLALSFLMKMTEGVASPMIAIDYYVSFALSILFFGALTFEIPVVAGLLTKAGIITPHLMQSKRKEAIFSLFVIAALVTPTVDAFNMLLFSIPLIALYEISIIVSKAVYRSRLEKKEIITVEAES